MELLILIVGILIGLINIIFNKQMAERSADFEKMFSKMPKEKLLQHYRVGGYIGGIVVIILAVLRLLEVI